MRGVTDPVAHMERDVCVRIGTSPLVPGCGQVFILPTGGGSGHDVQRIPSLGVATSTPYLSCREGEQVEGYPGFQEACNKWSP